jgi:hypothetical protein
MFNSTFLQIFIKNLGLDPGRVSRIPAKYLHHRIRIRNNAYKEISLFYRALEQAKVTGQRLSRPDRANKRKTKRRKVKQNNATVIIFRKPQETDGLAG